MRIVSLLASATETVCELGAGEALVGRSHECDYPAWVRRLPSLSRPTFEVDGSSADIDRRVGDGPKAGILRHQGCVVIDRGPVNF